MIDGPECPHRAISNAQLTIGILFAFIFLFFSVTARFRVLYKDDWDWVAPLLLHTRLRDYVFLGGNEHIIVLPRVLMWLEYRTSGLPGPLMWAVGLGCYLLTALTLVEHEWRRAALPPAIARAAAGATLSLLFFTYQLQVFLSPAGITVPLVVALAVGAMLAVIQGNRRSERGTHAAWWLLAAAFVVAAILTSGQGLAVPFALAALVLTARGPRVVPQLVGVVAFTIGAVWYYAHATGAHAPSYDAHSVALATLFGAAFFAGPVSYGSVVAGVLVGTAALAAGMNEAYFVVRRGRRSSDCQLLCLGIIVFVLFTAAMTALARAPFGVAQASQSRYALFAMLHLSAVLALWTIRMSESPVGQRRLRAAALGALVLMVAALPMTLFVGAVWWAKAQNARTAALALRVHVPDFEWIRTLHPDPARPYEWSRAIPSSGPMGSSPATSTSLPQCQGDIRLQPMDAAGFFRISGRVTAPSGQTIVLQDNSGTIRGLAEPAPVINLPDPTYGQVIAAVWSAIRRGRFHEPEWFGFAQRGTGPPYRALAIENGSAICSVSVSGL
jgi:hypothetical protein